MYLDRYSGKESPVVDGLMYIRRDISLVSQSLSSSQGSDSRYIMVVPQSFGRRQ